MRILVVVFAAVLTAGSVTFAVAQHQHHHDPSAPVALDSRQFVEFPAPLVEHTLAKVGLPGSDRLGGAITKRD